MNKIRNFNPGLGREVGREGGKEGGQEAKTTVPIC